MNKKKPLFLICPLNWGLGHATRCMPIIRELLAQGAEVMIASDGRSLKLLESEFPTLKCIHLPGYQIQYNSDNGGFVKTMVGQIPKILYLIRREHQLLQRIVQFYKVDVVLSDNRFGCWSKHCRSIFMTHQLFIKMPEHLRFLEPSVKWVNFGFINRYQACWVPDFDRVEDSLSGDLAHQYSVDKKVFRFIGPLSRLKRQVETPITHPLDILVVLSGPEPQRSIFEAEVLRQALTLDQHTTIVRGVTETKNRRWENDKIQIIDYLTAEELNAYLLAAPIVVARAGYSTIMDLVALEKTAILVPTPEQTEQEYLGKYFMDQDRFYAVLQEDFDLGKAVGEVEQYGNEGYEVEGVKAMIEEEMKRFY